MKQEYVRRDHVITDMKGNIVFTGMVRRSDGTDSSINAAKRESRKLQGDNLGCGILRVSA